MLFLPWSDPMGGQQRVLIVFRFALALWSITPSDGLQQVSEAIARDIGQAPIVPPAAPSSASPSSPSSSSSSSFPPSLAETTPVSSSSSLGSRLAASSLPRLFAQQTPASTQVHARTLPLPGPMESSRLAANFAVSRHEASRHYPPQRPQYASPQMEAPQASTGSAGLAGLLNRWLSWIPKSNATGNQTSALSLVAEQLQKQHEQEQRLVQQELLELEDFHRLERARSDLVQGRANLGARQEEDQELQRQLQEWPFISQDILATHAFWAQGYKDGYSGKDDSESSGSSSNSNKKYKPDPIGICIGFLAALFAAYSVYRSKREANRIISLFEANTQIKELEEKARRGEPLPPIVVIRGMICADGGDVFAVTPRIGGLREKLGQIEQPKNAWIEIARQAKRDPQLKGVADAVVERTGVDAVDVPDVPEPGERTLRESTTRGEGSLVLSEILVARICAKHQRRTEDKRTKRLTIKRPCRNESYNCFHARHVAEGLHLVDLDGTRAELDLPPADAVGLAGIPEPPPLFLPVNDVWTEFTHYLRRDGLTGTGGRHQRLDGLPAMRLSDPYTLLSEFIFIDVQSPGDLGGMPTNPNVLVSIAEAYRGRDGPGKFLWEPRGFYDSVKGGGYDDVPAYAGTRLRRTEMVDAQELIERAQEAARQNAQRTPFCEPTFTREQLQVRRDQENCFRYTELAIRRNTPVTVLARPMVAEAGTGEGADIRIRLTSPMTEVEEGKPSSAQESDPKADRFRFRIRPGHTVENLLRLRHLNVNAYYGLAVVGLAFAGWASAGYPGMSAG